MKDDELFGEGSDNKGDFDMDGQFIVSGKSGNPRDEYDEEIIKQLNDFRDSWYSDLRTMRDKKNSPMWSMIRDSRKDELMRVLMILDRVVAKGSQSLYAVKSMENTSDFTRRYNIPSKFKDEVKSLRKMIDNGETESAKNKLRDVAVLFDEYRDVASTTTTMISAEMQKLFYLFDGLRLSIEKIRDVRYSMLEDTALLIDREDYVDIVEVTYLMLVEKMLEENDDLILPRDVGDINIKDKLSDIGGSRLAEDDSKGYKDRLNGLVDDFFDGKMDESEFDDSEVREAIDIFGKKVVRDWFKSIGYNLDDIVG